jgi:hypothetical protein
MDVDYLTSVNRYFVKSKQVVIYTALFGDYDNLIEPAGSFPGCLFVCFTDQKHLKSKVWDVRFVEKNDMPNNFMNRHFKFFPNLYFKDYDLSIYVDSHIRLLSNPYNLVLNSLKNHKVAVPKHISRLCIYEEAKVVVSAGRAPKEQVHNQMEAYFNDGYPKDNGLGEMGIIMRRHSDLEVINLMNLWWFEYSTRVPRDQLSFCYVSWKSKIDINFVNDSARKVNKYFFLECHKHDPVVHQLKRHIKRWFTLAVLFCGLY